MAKYIAFLRGINVGGNKIIKMDLLKKLFESMKFKNVETFIQSGNVIFESKESNQNVLENKIEKLLEKKLGFEVKILIRTKEGLEKIAKKSPFKDKKDENMKVYVVFLSAEPKTAPKSPIDYGVDGILFEKKEIHILFDKRRKVKSPFSNALIEKKSGIKSTTRDLNTIIRIIEICK